MRGGARVGTAMVANCGEGVCQAWERRIRSEGEWELRILGRTSAVLFFLQMKQKMRIGTPTQQNSTPQTMPMYL